jgi:hypothetical protein
LLSNPNSRHIFSITEFSWRIWPDIRFRPSDLTYSMINCIKDQPSPLPKVRSQQNRVLGGLMARVGMQSHDAERLLSGFIDGDKSHRARIVEIDQSGDELMRKLLDGIEEAKPQIFLIHVS